MAVALVQSKAGGVGRGTTTATSTAVGYTSNTTAGDLLVLVAIAAADGTICSISTPVTSGFTWTLASSSTFSDSTLPQIGRVSTYYIANASAMSSATTTTVAASTTKGATFIDVAFTLYEFSGVAIPQIATFSYVQGGATSTAYPTTTTTYTFASSVTSGNTILVGICVFDQAISTITDNHSNTYNLVTSIVNGGFTEYFYYANVGTTASTTITVTMTGSVTNCWAGMNCHEVSGLATSPVNVSNNSTGSVSGGSFSTGSVTTTNANDIIFSHAATYASTKPASYTAGTDVIFSGAGATQETKSCYLQVSSTGVYNPTWTSTGASYLGVTVALQLATLTSAVDVSSTGSNSTATPTTIGAGSLTTTASDLILVGMTAESTAGTAGSGYTLGVSQPQDVGRTQYILNQAAGSIATAFGNTAAYWAANAVAFKSGAVSGNASPSGVSMTSVQNAPTVSVSVNASPSGVSMTSVENAPTILGINNVSPSGVSATSAQNAPTPAGAGNASPSGVAMTSAIGTAIVASQGNAVALFNGVNVLSSVGTSIPTGTANAFPNGVSLASSTGTVTLSVSVPSYPYEYLHQYIRASTLIQPFDNESFFHPTTTGHTGFAFDGIHYTSGVKGNVYASWYSEPFSSYRGSTQNFPTSAIVLLSDVALTIMDETAPNLPLWMQFLIQDNFMMGNNITSGLIGFTPTYLTYSNGVLSVIAIPDSGSTMTTNLVITFDFVTDSGYAYLSVTP